jgi:hypothetical protein
MKQLFAMVLLALLPLPAGAATYSWTDTAGTVHFTDDPGTVPAKFRKKAKRYDSEPIPQSLLIPDQTAQDNKPEPAVVQPQISATAQPSAVPSATVTQSTRLGERTAEEWQTEFRALRKQIATIEQQLEQVKREGEDGKSMLTRQRIDELNARNKKLYGEHETLRLRFNRLVEEANAVGLPPEFAQ